MEGFCILWAGKLVIGSAVSSCAKCRQETKMWTLVIGTPLYLVRISWFLLRGEMELSQLEMISGRGGASSRIATNPFRFTLNSVSLRLPSIHLETPAPHQNHVPSHILSIGVRKLGREASEARQSKPTDENQSLQMKWTKSFGSTTIRQSDEMNENDPRKIEDHKLPLIFLDSHNASPKPLLRANEMTILFERGPIYCFTASPENCSELHFFRLAEKKSATNCLGSYQAKIQWCRWRNKSDQSVFWPKLEAIPSQCQIWGKRGNI